MKYKATLASGHLATLVAICDTALEAPRNEDGSMRERFVTDPNFYKQVRDILEEMSDISVKETK